MKLKYIYCLLSLALALALSFTSCNDDDDNFVLPQTISEAFTSKYPSAMMTSWEKEANYYVADFLNGGREAEAWFDANGNWVRTETDYLTNDLPRPVADYIAANYAGYFVDDADLIDSPTTSFFRIELEKNGTRDVMLNINPDGTLLK